MQCFPQNSSCFFSLCIANCIPVCHHAKKFCAVDDKNSVVLCELFYRLQRDGSAQVGLLGLRTRMCYKNTQFILIIRFEIMIPLNIHKSPLNGHINMRFFSELQLSSVSHSFKSYFSSLEYLLGYICGQTFGILGAVPEVQASSQQSHMDFQGSGRSYRITFMEKRGTGSLQSRAATPVSHTQQWWERTLPSRKFEKDV